jgi:hypothetical protein
LGTVGVVADPAVEGEVTGEPPDGGAEAYALDAADAGEKDGGGGVGQEIRAI